LLNAMLKSLALLYQSEGKNPDTELLWASSSPEIPRLLAIGPGKVVADVGGGDGELTLDLARRVGPTGRVFSTDIDTAQLALIKDKVAKSDLCNTAVVLGREDDAGLQVACCDAIVLRLVYHHLTDPVTIATSLHRALRAGGRLMIIDFRPGNPRVCGEVPRNREGHGVRPELVIAELAGAGFEFVDQVENWDQQAGRYCLVFRRKPNS
jgi:SAM-dependent methyltransferase